MEALSVVASVAIVCGSALVAFRWWLTRKPDASVVQRVMAEEVSDVSIEQKKQAERIAALESWKTRSELGKLR